jgi:hypothetical protein
MIETRRKFYLNKDIISVTEFKATCESGDIFLAKYKLIFYNYKKNSEFWIILNVPKGCI